MDGNENNDREIESYQSRERAEIGDGKTTLHQPLIAGEKVKAGSMVYIGDDGCVYNIREKEPDRIVVDKE